MMIWRGRRWFLSPINNIPVLEKRLDAVEYFMDDQHREDLDYMGPAVKRIKNLAVSAFLLLLYSEDFHTNNCC